MEKSQVTREKTSLLHTARKLLIGKPDVDGKGSQSKPVKFYPRVRSFGIIEKKS